MKNPLTPSEIEPATFQLVAQCLDQLRHGVPLKDVDWIYLDRTLKSHCHEILGCIDSGQYFDLNSMLSLSFLLV
jgi:hypothetical protein